MPTFPFGAPVRDLARGALLRPVRAFVLGAYPSATHVEWTPPAGLGRRVNAVPVDNEPFPFWDGSGMDHFVERWRSEHFRPEWGRIQPSVLNGSSGRALYRRWLEPLGIEPHDYVVTDCLPTSMMSAGVEKVVSSNGVYARLAATLGLPPVDMPTHPSENRIVESAVKHHGRLREQIAASQATVLVTLGNAAARVVAALGGQAGGQLRHNTYLEPRLVEIEGRSLEWHALVHPAVRPPWVERHDQWVAHRRRV